MVKTRAIIDEYDTYVPGRSKKEIMEKYGVSPEDIIKLGSNENPWGASPKAKQAIIDAIDEINRYPESNHEYLKEKIAEYANVKPEQVIVTGDGADELFDVLAKTLIDPGDEFITHPPTYTYYEYTFKVYGAKPVYAKWDLESNTLDVDSVLENITDKTKAIFLCTPNNPTGGLISQDDIIRIIEATDALVVVDEAYWEFAEVNNINLLDKYDNVLIIRTFSKILGLAGLRIGYGLSNPELLEKMSRIKPVFSVTVPSQKAVIATLDDEDYINNYIKKSIDEREYLYESVSNIDNLHIYPSKSNYLLVDLHDSGFTAAQLADELMKRGVIVRDCTSFRDLDEYYMRISIETHPKNEKFIEILDEIVNG
ncbi:histidinol-phosphate transaminase [Methanosphaera cuniculi]|uniref:Histidinol-phosphate aminotransferase n=1 Tax=Methanosphaera cuniculi TaxID=1077256 RepID=A0A2A2HCS9_9EURY|nr:histidinol-phosphate transaminase [Methanosphaera cuniculi]PAV07187.1 histidinol-phosphate aminotransferase [Methanosphaera cuniculi]PWL07643.1 histidinol-phosphate aminotransferase 2 [Methanosphaera cuniculi]